ncbi:flagellar motor switch phosphatase FliY [Vagococcus penaei]|uniref:Flagellar motor switch phosphatase FliY n=1 Tax=Vagococcus penaei TaxID=633807 RepID=A0A1Q2D837_9ENTE|nr:flagellar motor switch phosphatase FliY [Vagococcus penaei]AQP54588.1 flagellar motor switch phosphatase FliY [Vagococcus penaei]RSU06700.1 flagellar motor switch phosphatase FliY [Vagococcus penaei]
MSEQLTQEQIDQLLNGGGETQPATEPTLQVDQQIADLIGEVGNISMSQAATTLSSILNRRVNITTPKVSYVHFKEILAEMVIPKVSTVVEFKEGLEGSNFLLLNTTDAIIIADLMMGGDGQTDKTEFTELELSAVGEAMNQMIGSASTSMATMIGRKVDILPPSVLLWEDEDAVQYTGIAPEMVVCKVSFSLSVEGVIDSEIMQIYSQSMVERISSIMLSDKAEVLENREPAKTVAESTVKATPVVEKAATVEQPERKKITVQKPEFQDLSSHRVESSIDNLDLIMDVPLDFSVALGNTRMSIKEILTLGVGSVIELNKLTDEPLEVYVNGKLIAHGEVVVINENFGIRITKILSQKQRLTNLY